MTDMITIPGADELVGKGVYRVVPMDRQFTGAFFGWNTHDWQAKEEHCAPRKSGQGL